MHWGRASVVEGSILRSEIRVKCLGNQSSEDKRLMWGVMDEASRMLRRSGIQGPT